MNDHPANHTRLYIILVLIIVFAVAFFLLRPSYAPVIENPPIAPIPPELQKMTLTPGEAAVKERVLADPALTATVTLTPAESAAKKKMLADPSVTAR